MNCILHAFFRVEGKNAVSLGAIYSDRKTENCGAKYDGGTEKAGGTFRRLFTYGNSGKHKPVWPTCRESVQTGKVKC